MTSVRRAWLVDTSIYIFRAYFSLPERWHSPQGYPLNAVYGFASFLIDLLGRRQGEALALAFDESLGSCFRNEIYADYKCRRELPDEALAFQLDTCRQLAEALALPCYSGTRYEADDYLATLARQYREQGVAVSVLTRDKDLGQLLLGPKDEWWDYSADVRLNAETFTERHGVSPARFGEYLALVGDAIDDIPGVPGVGPKTAAALLQHFESLQSLLDGSAEIATLPVRGAKGLVGKIATHSEQIQMAARLTALADAVPDVACPPVVQLEQSNLHAFVSALIELGLEGALTRRALALASESERAER